MKNIPQPPADLFDSPDTYFRPSPQIRDWVLATFLNPDSELHNPDHSHLVDAQIGYLFAADTYETKGRRVLGTAEQPRIGRKWTDGRKAQQLLEWFDDIPDFIITIDSRFWTGSGNPERCALLEHELYHCAQAKDGYGMAKFDRQTGKPVYTVVAHDVEEFIGVVRRYGAEASRVDEMVRAANQGPEIAPAVVDGICGNCKKRVA